MTMMKVEHIILGYILITATIAVWAAILVYLLTGCVQRFPIGNDLYIQKIKIESRECNLFNGVKLCSEENV